MTFLALMAVVVGIHAGILRVLRRNGGGDRRLGLLPTAVVLTTEASREARLRQLGKAGTYRVYNCGKILHVDYERGELVVEREAR